MPKYLILFSLIVPIIFMGCGSTEQRQEIPPELLLTAPAIAVTISQESCTTIEVTPGTQVIWTNGDTIALAIKLEQLDEAGTVINAENYELQPGSILTKIFPEPATYRYTCSEDMDGYSTITVKE